MNQSLFWLLAVLTSTVLGGLYYVDTKKIQTGGWEKRTALLTGLHFGGTAMVLLIPAALTGGANIQPGFWLPFGISSAINIWLCWLRLEAQARADVSLVRLVASITPLLASLVAMLWPGEFPTLLGWTGIAVTVGGSSILELSEKLADKELDTGQRQGIIQWLLPLQLVRTNSAVRLALLAAVLNVFAPPAGALVARRANIAFGAGLTCVMIAIVNLFWAIKKRQYVCLTARELWRVSGFLSVLNAAQTYLLQAAMTTGLVAYTANLRKLQSPLVVLFAFLRLGERKNLLGRVASSIVMAIGATLIAIAAQQR